MDGFLGLGGAALLGPAAGGGGSGNVCPAADGGGSGDEDTGEEGPGVLDPLPSEFSSLLVKLSAGAWW